MAEGPPRQALSATFPEPPHFYKNFTVKNLERLKGIHDASPEPSQDGQSTSKRPSTFDLPPELRCLIPPEPPREGRYRIFGGQYDVWHDDLFDSIRCNTDCTQINEELPGLKEQGIEQLYPSPPRSPIGASTGTQVDWTLDRAFYIKKIAKSILLNFLELVGILANNPEQYGPKIDHFNALFFNAHHLINEYRPHQARESLILMMEEQLERQQGEIDKIKKMKEKVEALLSSLGEVPEQPQTNVEDIDTSAREVAESKLEQRRMWQALEEEFAS